MIIEGISNPIINLQIFEVQDKEKPFVAVTRAGCFRCGLTEWQRCLLFTLNWTSRHTTDELICSFFHKIKVIKFLHKKKYRMMILIILLIIFLWSWVLRYILSKVNKIAEETLKGESWNKNTFVLFLFWFFPSPFLVDNSSYIKTCPWQNWLQQDMCKEEML